MEIGLRYGPLPPNALHLCIDMQNMFAEGTRCASPAVKGIEDAVVAICERYALHTVFTRFITPTSVGEARGQWHVFYENCPDMLGCNLPKEAFELVPALRIFIPPAIRADRYVYSAFASLSLADILTKLRSDTLILTGVETDVCMLATLMGAIDRGFRTIVVTDAVASSDPNGHHAILDFVAPRFEHQIELIDCAQLFRNWQLAA